MYEVDLTLTGKSALLQMTIYNMCVCVKYKINEICVCMKYITQKYTNS